MCSRFHSKLHGFHEIDLLPTRQQRATDLADADAVHAVLPVFSVAVNAMVCGDVDFVGVDCYLVSANVADEVWKIEILILIAAAFAGSSGFVVAIGIAGAAVVVDGVANAVVVAAAAHAAHVRIEVAVDVIAIVGVTRAAACTAESDDVVVASVAAAVYIAKPFVLQLLVPLRL